MEGQTGLESSLALPPRFKDAFEFYYVYVVASKDASDSQSTSGRGYGILFVPSSHSCVCVRACMYACVCMCPFTMSLTCLTHNPPKLSVCKDRNLPVSSQYLQYHCSQLSSLDKENTHIRTRTRTKAVNVPVLICWLMILPNCFLLFKMPLDFLEPLETLGLGAVELGEVPRNNCCLECVDIKSSSSIFQDETTSSDADANSGGLRPNCN